jgi:methionine biosynthesis protein MetW
LGISKEYFQAHLAGRGGAPHYYRIRKAIKAFQRYVPEPERLLDIGCDDGGITTAIKDAIGAKQAYGIEIFETAQKTAIARGISCIRMDIDKENLPFPDSYFSAIFSGENIEHLFDTDHLLDEIYRCLSPNGICVISTPNLASFPNRIALAFGCQPYMTSVSIRHQVGRMWHKGLPAEDHIRVFTYRAFIELIHIHNFKILKIQGLTASDGSDPPFPFPVRLIERTIALVPSCSHTIQIAMKK